jgi:hypothetical protein
MTLVKTRKELYLQRKVDREVGKVNGIPWFYTFPKLGKIIPSLPKGYPILWTANSGVGKTQSWIGIFLFTIYKLKKEHPELKLKIKLVIALLEDTKEMFIDRLFTMLLFQMYKIVVDCHDLHSLRENPLSQDIIQKLDEVEKEIEFILEDCEIIDSVYNPTGLYKWARTISNKYGVHYNKTMLFTNEKGEQHPQEVYSHYTLNDPDMQFLMIVDNLNNLSQEMRGDRLLNERESINRWTRDYCRLQITKHWNWDVVNVIQQASDSEKQQFDFKGNTIIEKIKPSLDGLGNSKECQRDHFLIFGLFAPNRYGINEYEGYDISRLQDNYRSLIILKSNISPTNIEIPFYFNGACSALKEMPKSDDSKIEDFYRYAEKNRNI